ncbi:MAG TPA: hypothetical protein VGS05_18220 [Candidatus Sulfotelmatobacter sp.]|nr:hypothetical protein [Candidatus Sulfotelmatobacter sp.]
MSIRRFVLTYAAGILAWAAAGLAQDSQSIADVARQTRQKQQQQAAAASDAANGPADPSAKVPAKAAHVYTNDEIPEHTGPDVNSSPRTPAGTRENYKGGKQSAEQWKSQIRQLKNNIASLHRQIDNIQNSVRFAGGNYERHVLYNDRQRQKEQQVENLKSQLDQQQKRLEDMQEQARHQGYSSAVYDP